MNKKYIFSIFLSALSLLNSNVKAQDASIVIRIDTKDNVMKEHAGTTSKDKVTVVQRNSANAGELLQWGGPNVSFKGAWYTSAARLYNSTVAGGTLQYPNYPYLEIQRTGANKFTHIEVTGVFEAPASLSMIPMGFSEDGITFTDFQVDEPYLYFGGDLEQPSPGSYAVPAIALDAEYNMTTKIPVPENINYIRIAASNKSFSGTPLNPGGFDPAYIYQVSLWTKDDGIPSSIGNANENSFRVNIINNELQFTEVASQVSVYSISGQLVESASNVHTLSFSGLPSGMYVIKARSQNGNMLTTKIVR